MARSIFPAFICTNKSLKTSGVNVQETFKRLQSLEEVIHDIQKRGVRVIITGANPKVEAKLRKAGILKLLGAGNLFKEFSQALAAC